MCVCGGGPLCVCVCRGGPVCIWGGLCVSVGVGLCMSGGLGMCVCARALGGEVIHRCEPPSAGAGN